MAQSEGSSKRSSAAGGWGALKSCGKHLLGSRAPLTGARALLKADQPDGFDCPGCAWGDPEHGSSFEFCENDAKAVSWEATDKRTPPSFFARHTLADLRGWSDDALERSPLAGYYPELKVLVPLSTFSEKSDTPTSKSVLVTLQARAAA